MKDNKEEKLKIGWGNLSPLLKACVIVSLIDLFVYVSYFFAGMFGGF